MSRRVASYVHLFQSDEQMDENLQNALMILEKNPESRTAKEINVLVKDTAHIAFFQNSDIFVHQECVKYMRAIFLPKGATVFRYGEIGTTFFVILQGSVGVLIGGTSIGELWREVRVLNTGEAFGELALINNKPRSATIVCKENCYFAVLEKEYYNNILRNDQRPPCAFPSCTLLLL